MNIKKILKKNIDNMERTGGYYIDIRMWTLY